MTDLQMTLAEQLCAMMDGELPESQARFLRKRLENDSELRDLWSRMHLASSCLKGQPAIPMSPSLCLGVRKAISDSTPARGNARSGWLRWGVAASVAVLALAVAPQFMPSQQGDANPGALVSTTPAPRELPSPSAADLVGVHSVAAVADGTAGQVAQETPSAPATVADGALLATRSPAPSSPMPLDAQSPADFPLVDTGDKRAWPRSQIVAGASGPSLEAYLVRHNQMLANDGLGGFVPYVDVVARDPASTQDDGATANAGTDNP